jgi:hypothetical protein
MYTLIPFDDDARVINTGIPVLMSEYRVSYSANFDAIFSAYDNYNKIVAKDSYLVCDPRFNSDGLETYTIWPYVEAAITFLGHTPACARVRRFNGDFKLDSGYASRQIGEIFALTVEFIDRISSDMVQIGMTTIMFNATPIYDILPKIALSIINNIAHMSSNQTTSTAIFRKFNAIIHIFRAEFHDNSLGAFSLST